MTTILCAHSHFELYYTKDDKKVKMNKLANVVEPVRIQLDPANPIYHPKIDLEVEACLDLTNQKESLDESEMEHVKELLTNLKITCVDILKDHDRSFLKSYKGIVYLVEFCTALSTK